MASTTLLLLLSAALSQAFSPRTSPPPMAPRSNDCRGTDARRSTFTFHVQRQQLRRQRSTVAFSTETDGSTDLEESEQQEIAFVEEQREVESITEEDKALVERIYAAGGGMEEAVTASLPSMHPRLVLALQRAAVDSSPDVAPTPEEAEEATRLQAVGKALQQVLDVRLEGSRDLLATLLKCGEIRKLDGAIGRAAKEGKLDSSFFTVLNMNIRDASNEASKLSDEEKATLQNQSVPPSPEESGDGGGGGGANRLQILQHIYTRCQEEVEKMVAPGVGLLNKLLRTEIPSIRSNQLKHYLGPQASTVTTPDGKEIPLKGNAKPLVSHEEFIDALSNAVRQIRTIERAGGTDRVAAAGLVESCRQVAIEAMQVLAESYGAESLELREYQQKLQPVFRPSSAESEYIRGE